MTDVPPSTPLALAIALRDAGKLVEAVVAFQAVLAKEPEDTNALYALGNVYRDLLRFDDAEREMREVIRRRPGDAQPYSALGIILSEAGRLADAMEAFNAAMGVDPGYVNAATNWLNTQQYLPGATEADLAKSSARWAALHAPPTPPPAFTNRRTTDRPLVVGFVSPDMAAHPVGALSVRLFENLDRAVIKPIVFSTRPTTYEDALSARIARVSTWTSVFGVPDEVLAEFIKASQVDILIDMSGHTGGHRMKLFARRAAPVQMSWLGYPGTTGVPAVDYLLATEPLTPAGADAHYREKIIRLPHWHACFDPPADAPEVGPLPATRNGFVTFGCFSNPMKLSSDAIAGFSAILARVPAAKLRLRYRTFTDVVLQARLRNAFATHGIGGERLLFSGHAPYRDFLDAYNDVDIALDTFPYSGCMTTCEASWMGCPVVTFPGATFAGRQSAAFLSAAGLSKFIAADRRAFEDLAVDLAADQSTLVALRAGLRTQVAASPACDGVRFARDFSAALTHAWATWCAQTA